MKTFCRVFSLMVLTILFLSAVYIVEPSLGKSNEEDLTVNVWLVLRLRDYETDMPISNVTVKAKVSSAWGNVEMQESTNETGTIQVFVSSFTQSSDVITIPRTPPRLYELTVWDNYTVIKINNVFMDEVNFKAGYWYRPSVGLVNCTTYWDMAVTLKSEAMKSQIFIECDVWVLKGKLVKISDYNPITDEKESLDVKPAVEANLDDVEVSPYESYYFFPLNYNVTIRPASKYNLLTAKIPSLGVRVDENTTLIHWMYFAAEWYINEEVSSLGEELEWFKALGLPLTQEYEEYNAIKSHLERALNLLLLEDYGPALGGIRRSMERLGSLRSWLSDQRMYSVLTAISICLFAYGLASLIPRFILEERVGRRVLLTSKILIFSAFLAIFSLTHFSFKITYASMISGMFGTSIIGIDVPTTLWGCFLLGTSIYFFLTLMSLRRAAITDLSLQLGIRGLKRRVSRTLLTLITITIIVSSAIILVNVSIARASRVKEAWPGTDRSGVIIQANILKAPLSEYDVNWTRTQEWCEDIGYREEIVPLGEQLTRWGILIYGGRSITVEIIGVDPEFLERNYNFSRYVRGVWSEFVVGEPVAVVSNAFEVPVGDYVTLGVGEAGTGSWWEREFGEFRVVGKFDPSSLLKLVKVDNNPLFEETSNLVLVPIKSIKDYSMVISEATVIVKEGFDPMEVAKKIAYILGVTTIANVNGLAKKIEWTVEWTVTGFFPYLFPLVIAGMMVYITMTSIYEERKREVMVMATLGLDPKNTFQVFVIEALLLGFLGTLLGFLGSYLLVIVLQSLIGILAMVGTPISGEMGLSTYVHWSLPAVMVAILTGTIMTFLGAYVPASRAQGLSLLGRVKRRRLVGEFMIEKDTVSLTLPLRVPIQSSDLLYRFIRENVGKFKSSIVDPHSVKGEVRRDGTFTVSFIVREPGRSIFIPCEVKGLREGDSIIPVVEFPAKYKSYERVRRILRSLEEYMIGFAAWKDMQRKMKIIREAPKRRKTPEEILIEVKEVIKRIRDDTKRLKFLESRKSQLSENIYEEFRQKYLKRIEDETKKIRALAIGLESYHDELNKEIKKIEVEIERFTIAYNLGEINEEEYVKRCGPLQARLDVLRSKFRELEEIFEFLRMPSRMV